MRPAQQSSRNALLNPFLPADIALALRRARISDCEVVPGERQLAGAVSPQIARVAAVVAAAAPVHSISTALLSAGGIRQ